jgi:hypothetical protein
MCSIVCSCCDVSVLVQFVSVQLYVAVQSMLLAFSDVYAAPSHLLAVVVCIEHDHTPAAALHSHVVAHMLYCSLFQV